MVWTGQCKRFGVNGFLQCSFSCRSLLAPQNAPVIASFYHLFGMSILQSCQEKFGRTAPNCGYLSLHQVFRLAPRLISDAVQEGKLQDSVKIYILYLTAKAISLVTPQYL